MLIELPWPSRALHPNARPFWAEKAKAAKKARADGYAAARLAGANTLPISGLSVSITFFPPNRRAHDADGVLASLKSAFDGIADCVGVDDSKWKFSRIKRGEVRKHGAVHVEIEVMQ